MVVEDSPAGIRAGKAAGCKVLGLAIMHSIAQLKAASPTWIVEDPRSIGVVGEETAIGEVKMEISDTLVV